MRTLTCMVVGLTFALAGCDSDMRSQLESEAKRLEAKCDALKRENETLRLAADNLRAEKAVMEKDLARLKSDNNSLKTQLESEKESAAAQIEELKAQLAAARQVRPPPGAAAAPPTPAHPAGAGSRATPGAPATPPAPVRDEAQIAEAEQAVADVQARIEPLLAQVNLARGKVMSLIRATVDVRMIPPAGGYISGGMVYGLACNATYQYHTHDSHCYKPIGPAVRVGDFRTAHDKEKAVQAAKEANMPLELELKTLSDELKKTKEKLAKLRALPAPN